jgi:hypothetical protein
MPQLRQGKILCRDGLVKVKITKSKISNAISGQNNVKARIRRQTYERLANLAQRICEQK